MGENELIKINPENSIIIRTSNLYSSYGDNFVKKIISKGLINENIIIKSNQVSSPTYAQDLAQAIFKLMTNINNKGIQIYHYSTQENVQI